MISLWLLAAPLPARAQGEWSRWYFGHEAGLRFKPDSAVVLRDSRMSTIAGCATISDSVGNLLLYSNGRRVWNRRHQVLLNGASLDGDSTCSQGVSIVPNPRRRGFYYVFTLDGWLAPLRRGLRVSEVDVNAGGGRGQVFNARRMVLPDTLLRRLGNHDMMEMQGLVRHSNGRDYWLVTHLLESNVFFSVLVNGDGFPRSTAVLSAVGQTHLLMGNQSSLPDAAGMLAVSPNGRRLALISQILGCEVFDFNPATGRVSNPIRLGVGVYSLGAAFSPNGNLLYIARQGPGFPVSCTLNAISEVRQFDLRLPTPAAVVASELILFNGCGSLISGLQRGPDGRIYVAKGDVSTGPFPLESLDVIQEPNVQGAGCRYTTGALPLGPGRWVNRQFPVVPSDPPAARLQALLLPAPACAGQAAAFTVSGGTLGAPGDTLDWDFGDGATLRTYQPRATHAYATAGTYRVTVRLRNRVFGPDEQLQLSVRVAPRPALNLGPDLRLCPGRSVPLAVGPQPAGTTVRWHDGSTGVSYSAGAPGLYWAELTGSGGCTARDSVLVSLLPVPALTLAASKALCVGDSVLLSAGPQPAGTRYRWQDGSTDPTLPASAPGTYTLTLTTAEGCQTQAALVLRYGDECPLLLPNIITPNGDALNQTFVLRGLQAPEWSIRIYNRWGREVYWQERYDNAWSAAGQPAGVYYYLLRHATTGQQYKGWVEVQR